MEAAAQSRNFQIKVQYDPSKGDPRRVFKSMLSLIDALDAAGAEFVKGIDPDLVFGLDLQKTSDGSLVGDFIGWVKSKKKKPIPPKAHRAIIDGLSEAQKTIADSQTSLGPTGRPDIQKTLDRVRAIQNETAEKYAAAREKQQPIISVREFTEKQMGYVMSRFASGVLALNEGTQDRAYISIDSAMVELDKNIQPNTYGAAVLEQAKQELQTIKDPKLGPWIVSIDVIHYSSGAGWKIIHDGKKYPATMADQSMLERLQAQDDVLGAKDQLLVLAEFTTAEGLNGKFRPHCEIIEVIKKMEFTPQSHPHLLEDSED